MQKILLVTLVLNSLLILSSMSARTSFDNQKDSEKSLSILSSSNDFKFTEAFLFLSEVISLASSPFSWAAFLFSANYLKLS